LLASRLDPSSFTTSSHRSPFIINNESERVSQPGNMTVNKYNRRNGRMDGGMCRDTLSVLAIALLLSTPSEGKLSPLASIPTTHHGINLETLHLNERGGAAATRRRRHWKRYQPSHSLPRSEVFASAPSVSASYSYEPPVKSTSDNDVGGEIVEVAPKATPPSTTGSKHQGQHEGLSPTAITCMALLALQFGIQPILVRKFTPQTIVRSSVVLVQELVKFGIAGAIYFSGTKKETREKDFEGKI